MSDKPETVYILTHPSRPGICCVVDQARMDVTDMSGIEGLVITKATRLNFWAFLQALSKEPTNG